MQVMALTGGIASGKSTFCRLLAEYMPSLVIFDCDAGHLGEVRTLAAKERLHAAVTVRFTGAPVVNVFDLLGGDGLVSCRLFAGWFSGLLFGCHRCGDIELES